jgi:uncharacterized protein (DUF1330 family)
MLLMVGSTEQEASAMKAYVLAAETIKDQAMFDEYRKAVVGTLAPFSGQFIVRGGNLTVLEGEWPHPRLVIIEFPSRADSEGDLSAAEEFGRQCDHRRWGRVRLDQPTPTTAHACAGSMALAGMAPQPARSLPVPNDS